MQETIDLSGRYHEGDTDDNFQIPVINDDDDDDDQNEEEDFDDDGFIKKPASWSECLSMLCSQKEERHLKIQNPDGLLYLTFLHQSGMLFLVCKYFRILSTYII